MKAQWESIGITIIILNREGVGRDISVGIATRYGLDGPGIESRWGLDLPHPSRRDMGPTQPLIPCTVSVPWVKRPGRGVALTTRPHIAPRSKKE